jgi:CheY-like chemotaxis protein
VADILIADDNPHAHRMAEDILVPAGHRVVGVPDGQAAIRHIHEARPDLVLLDTKMPLADGLTVCRSIRSTPDLATVKIVMLAGPLEKFESNGADAEGFDSVLQKPLEAESLLRVVNGLVGEQAASVAVATIGNPLADLVKETLGEKRERVPEAAIREAIEAVLLAAMPAIVDRITERVSEKLKED